MLKKVMKKKWKGTMSTNPWEDLSKPDVSEKLSARRVSADNPWNFFWARGADDKHLFVLGFDPESEPQVDLPALKGIELSFADGNSTNERMLVYKLSEPELRDIFYRLCCDITVCAAKANEEQEAIALSLARTWRWHHLLRGGSDDRLSLEEQKGLIGELFIVEQCLIPEISEGDAVAAWQGPLGAAKDFMLGRVCVEAKVRRSSSTPSVIISSEFQLDDTELDALFLHVVALDATSTDDASGFSLTDVASRVKKRLEAAGPIVTDEFEHKLSSAGFEWDDDYSDALWIEGSSQLYQVVDGFPRILAGSLSPGLVNVKYTLTLDECTPFIVANEEFTEALRGGSHGNRN